MKTRTINSRQYAPDTRTVDIPPSALKKFIAARVSLTREAWPAGVDYTQSDGTVVQNIVIVARIFRSVDNVTWIFVGEAPFVGGTILKPNGDPLTESMFEVSFTGPDGLPLGKDGDVRVELQNFVTLRTAITATLYEEGDR